MAEPHDRRTEVFVAATGLFLRYGYRKTSMDEIASAVGLSRQGLYLMFPSKKALFTAVLDHMLAETTAAVSGALEDRSASVVDRVVAAFDAHTGAWVAAGATAASMDELLETSTRLVGDRVARFRDDLLHNLAAVLEPFADDTLSAADLAAILEAVSAGLKYRSGGRDAYLAGMRKAAQLVCRPRAPT